MSNNVDCERFVRGADEINRKRQVITRVISTLESMLNSFSFKGCSWKFQQVILAIPLDNLTFSWVHTKKYLGGEFTDQNGIRQFHWWGTVNRADGIPAHVVPTVYDHLSMIVEKTDEAFPSVGILAHFDFFSKQAD